MRRPRLLSVEAREIIKEWQECQRCSLGKTAYKHVLFQLPGDYHADVLFIGEAPGRVENIRGTPFVGPAGKILRRVLKYRFRDVDVSWGLANLLACRPTDGNDRDRPPESDEVWSCHQRLIKIIQLAQPFAIVSLGRIPERFIPEIAARAGYRNKIFYLFHPSFIKRTGGENSKYYRQWSQEIKKVIEEVEWCKATPGVERGHWHLGSELVKLADEPKILKAKVIHAKG